MSYTIIRSVAIVHDKNDNLYHLKITGCDNNVYPHHYHPFTTSGGYESKDRAALNILSAYLTGEFQGGSNDYSKFVKYFERGLVGEDLKKKLDALSAIDAKAWKETEGKRWSKINRLLWRFRSDIYKSATMLEAFKAFKAAEREQFYITLNGRYIAGVRNSKLRAIAKMTNDQAGAMKFGKVTAEYIKQRFSNSNPILVAA